LNGLLTIAEAAKELRVNHKFIRRAIKDGTLIARKLGTHTFRIKREDLDKFIEEGVE